MIKVNVEVDSRSWFRKIQNPQQYLKKKLKKISNNISIFKGKNIVFTIMLTSSLNIKKLNKKFRKIDKSTDVLSFPYMTRDKFKISKKTYTYIGDIAACYEIVNKRSKKTSFVAEFDQVWVHGLLHLMGFDHVKNKEYFKMNKYENKIIKVIL